MKTYLLFAWPDYEATGGTGDLIGRYDTLEEAKKVKDGLRDGLKEHWEIYNTKTGRTSLHGGTCE